MKVTVTRAIMLLLGYWSVGVSFTANAGELSAPPDGHADKVAVAMSTSFRAKNHVGMERVVQDPVQRYCSEPRLAGEGNDGGAAKALQQAALAAIPSPSDGQYLGDWRGGHEVAINGRGLQYSDEPTAENGGNCYACHQLDPREVAYGTLGPSLAGYGQRGRSPQVLTYTWGKLWNTHAYNLCSHMPRFGDQDILTEQQLQDVMAYLLDPNSPVNQPVKPLDQP